MGTGQTFYGYWTCDYCGEENRGDALKCKGCGKNRGKDVKFYPRPRQTQEAWKYVTDGGEQRPDWLCSYCDSLTPASENVCRNCGHTREESDKNYLELHPDREQARSEEDFMSEPVNQTASAAAPAQPVAAPARRVPRKALIIGGIALALLAVILYVFLPRQRNLTVSAKQWERSVAIEAYRTVQEEGWTVPPGGRQTAAYTAIHHYDQVLDHYETVTRSRRVPDGGHYEVVGYRDNGNGTFSEETRYVTDYRTEYYTEREPVYRSEPRYATRYKYDIERWVFDHDEVTRGGDDEPYFASAPPGGNWRTGKTSEKYTVTGSYDSGDGGKTQTLEMSYEDWTRLQVGQSANVKVHFGGKAELLD